MLKCLRSWSTTPPPPLPRGPGPSRPLLSTMPIREFEETITCPYNAAHQVQKSRVILSTVPHFTCVSPDPSCPHAGPPCPLPQAAPDRPDGDLPLQRHPPCAQAGVSVPRQALRVQEDHRGAEVQPHRECNNLTVLEFRSNFFSSQPAGVSAEEMHRLTAPLQSRKILNAVRSVQASGVSSHPTGGAFTILSNIA